MNLTKSNILIASIILLCVSFALFQIQGEYLISAISKSFIVPLFTILYLINVKRKSPYFTWFLILFSCSDLSAFLQFFLETKTALDTYYIMGNTFYITAYILLILEIVKQINLKKMFKEFKLHLIVLSSLNAYIVYMLMTIVYPVFKEDSFSFLEVIYNIVMLIFLSLALLAYMYNDNKKTLFFFLGALCIVFSEFLQIAYFYIMELEMLNFSSTLLFVLAFFFFYSHSRLKNENTLKWARSADQ